MTAVFPGFDASLLTKPAVFLSAVVSELDAHARNVEATSGFEPENSGFADRSDTHGVAHMSTYDYA
jgi:hypothetical protein